MVPVSMVESAGLGKFTLGNFTMGNLTLSKCILTLGNCNLFYFS